MTYGALVDRFVTCKRSLCRLFRFLFVCSDGSFHLALGDMPKILHLKPSAVWTTLIIIVIGICRGCGGSKTQDTQIRPAAEPLSIEC